MKVPKEILNQHVAVLGKTRSGKSSVMRGLVEHLLEHQKPVCIVDPKGDWYGLKLAADGRGPGYPIVIFGGEHADVPINEHAGAHVAELFATGNRSCLIDLGGWMVGPRTRFWIDFASTLFKHTKGQRWLAVDEIHNFAPKGKVFDADAGKALHWTNRLASEGLGKGVAMVFASQRPQKVHNDTLTSAETLIAMRVLHPSDRGAVADWIKGCGDSEGSEVLNSLAQMERGEGWVWSPEIGFGPKRVKFPMFATYDSFRPQSVEDTKKLKGWAEVDLDEVRARLGKVVEEAKSNDPKELKRQIAELRTQLAAGKQSVETATIRQVKEVPVLTDADRALIEKLVTALAERSNQAKDTISVADRRLDEAVQKAAAEYLNTVRKVGMDAALHVEQVLERATVTKLLEKLNGLSIAPVPVRQVSQNSNNPPARPSTPTSSTSNASRTLSTGDGEASVGRSGLRRMLIALAQRNGLTRAQLGMRAAVSSKGGSFDTYVSKGRVNGWITGTNGRFEVTDAGVAALGSYDPLPTGQALLEHYMRELGSGGSARMLRALAEAYPNTLTRDELGTVANVSPAGGSFDTYLSKLRTMELLHGERNAFKASDEFFE